MSKSVLLPIYKQELENLALLLRRIGCPPESAKIIRAAFWNTLTRYKKPEPAVYIEISLFEALL